MDRYGPKHVELTPEINKQSVPLHCVSRVDVYILQHCYFWEISRSHHVGAAAATSS